MREDIRRLDESINNMSLEEMAASFHRILKEYDEFLALQAEKERATHEMALQFSQMKSYTEGCEKENLRLKRELSRLSDQLNLRNKDLFGRTTEKIDAVMASSRDGEPEADPNPISEDQKDLEKSEETETADENSQPPKTPSKSGKGRGGNKGGKKKGKKEQDLSKLPHMTEFLFDPEALDAEFGPGNWRIYGWSKSEELQNVPATNYLQVTYTPILSVGLEHQLVRVPAKEKLLPHSLLSPSLLADILYNKFVLSVPFYRQSANLALNDVIISRQNMANWTIRFAQEKFLPVVQYLEVLLLQAGNNQTDETAVKVICDGRSAGSVSFLWTHTTSELYTGHPIIVFCYELTRGTQHLRDFYLDRGYEGTLTSDAYISYDVLEKEADSRIQNTHCFMHSRRRFVNALLLLRINIRTLTQQQIETLPEYRALILIDAIYEADTPLKRLTPEERRKKRDTEVRPKVDAFFAYLHSLNADDPAFSDRMRDAIQYSLRSEEKLRLFLEDPMIPCDNGYVERAIRNVAIGRNNWLFCFSVKGAEALAIVYTLVETAKRNHAHPYYYLMYLLEKMPVYSDTVTTELLEKMLPWSPEYRSYESEKKQESIKYFTDQEPVVAPKTPRIKDKNNKHIA